MSSTPSDTNQLKKAVALVDCNNFYVSCERIFRPDLTDRPVVVLSNNDGCIISRSNEAKQLGIRMGEPEFKARPTIKKHDIEVFSANFALYGDISGRVMQMLKQFSPKREKYSIDEAFLPLAEMPPDELEAYGTLIRSYLLQAVKIPTSIGIAETRTLAKVAAFIAKQGSGVCDLFDDLEHQEYVLRSLDVKDVWGVGWRTVDALRKIGIRTAWDLACADDKMLLHDFNTPLARTSWELRGVDCHQQEGGDGRKSITCSRSFSRLVQAFEPLKQAVITYTTRAAEKLREQQQAATYLSVYIRTNRHRKQDLQYANAAGLSLPVPTDCTHELIHYAITALKEIYRPEYRYMKAQVTFLGLTPKQSVQQGLFDTVDRDKQDRLMEVMDGLNRTFGSGSLRYAGEGFQKSWSMRQERRSPSYTTAWKQLPKVR